MSETDPAITWVNHAGFLLQAGDAGLLSDPWLSGTAFDDGWSLYSPTHFDSAVREATTHVWFSHEHPDHFSPASLRTIPEEERARITVLYQPKPAPNKVLDYCRSIGFSTIELPVDRWHRLGRDLEVRLLPWSSGDSVLAMRAGGRTILNVNDAVVPDRPTMQLLMRKLGNPEIDVLMTQFSYANWEGNPDDVGRRREAARAKLLALQAQAEVCRPGVVMPFASFVWFCHEENDYLNDCVNRVSDAVRATRAQGIAVPVVLYPGDRWTVGDDVDADAAAARYDADLAAVLEHGARCRSQPVELDELDRVAREFLSTLRRVNGAAAMRLLMRLGILAPTDIWLSDHHRAVSLSGAGLVATGASRDACDVELGSEALSFCLRNLYGGATLNVNGRFRLPPSGRPVRFRRWMQLANLNNQGVGVLGSLPELGRKAARVGRDRVRGLRSA